MIILPVVEPGEHTATRDCQTVEKFIHVSSEGYTVECYPGSIYSQLLISWENT